MVSEADLAYKVVPLKSDLVHLYFVLRPSTHGIRLVWRTATSTPERQYRQGAGEWVASKDGHAEPIPDPGGMDNCVVRPNPPAPRPIKNGDQTGPR